MITTLSSLSFDLNGLAILKRSDLSRFDDTSRRVTRVATLDASEVAFSDLGFSHGDRTFTIIEKRPSKALIDSVRYLQRTYPLLVLGCRVGCFSGAIQNMDVSNNTLTLTFLVKESLTEV